jgi:hypothetical protein
VFGGYVCVREVRLFSNSNRMMMIILGSTVEGQGGGTFHFSSMAPTPKERGRQTDDDWVGFFNKCQKYFFLDCRVT